MAHRYHWVPDCFTEKFGSSGGPGAEFQEDRDTGDGVDSTMGATRCFGPWNQIPDCFMLQPAMAGELGPWPKSCHSKGHLWGVLTLRICGTKTINIGFYDSLRHPQMINPAPKFAKYSWRKEDERQPQEHPNVGSDQDPGGAQVCHGILRDAPAVTKPKHGTAAFRRSFHSNQLFAKRTWTFRLVITYSPVS